MRKSIAICIYVNTVIAIALSLYLFLIPAGEMAWDLRDPGIMRYLFQVAGRAFLSSATTRFR
jgi:hypothetical protein